MANDLNGSRRWNRRAFTLIELAVVTVVIGILIAMVLPAVMRPQPHMVPRCGNNLKLVELAFRIFANDNTERPPWHVSTNEGGSREFSRVPFSAFQHFRVMSNELSTPRVLVCPVDKQRTSATNFASFRDNRALSYFVGLDAAGTNALSLLSGDRYLGSTRSPINGWLSLGRSSSLWWTNNPHKDGGNVVLGDGSVARLDSRQLTQMLRTNGVATFRLALPLLPP